MEKKVYIIILNWNGWQDTIECLESLQQLDYPNYRTIVLDNGSSNDSIERITAWASGKETVESKFVNYRNDNKKIRIVHYNRSVAEKGGISEVESELSRLHSSNKLVVIDNKENLGFAAGCNIGIRYALSSGADYVWLLNNDTVVAKESLSKLVNILETADEYHGVTPQIRFYKNPDKIWNCGGRLTLYGARRYYYINSLISSVPKSGLKRISFITFCATLLRISIFKELGLLTERFFVGEEDFEFSLRMKKHNRKLACLYDSIIYHKVGSSFKTSSSIGYNYINYLSRFINMRRHWPKSIWYLWRIFYAPYIYMLLKFKHNFRVGEISNMVSALFKNSVLLNEVDKETFMRALNFHKNHSEKI